jgi:hypothetical protein
MAILWKLISSILSKLVSSFGCLLSPLFLHCSNTPHKDAKMQNLYAQKDQEKSTGTCGQTRTCSV